MSKTLSRNQCLELDVETYNMVVERSWPKHKKKANLSGNLCVCGHCRRKYSICCICDKAQNDWNEMVEEVRMVQLHRDSDQELDNMDRIRNSVNDALKKFWTPAGAGTHSIASEKIAMNSNTRLAVICLANGAGGFRSPLSLVEITTDHNLEDYEVKAITT